MLYGLRLGMIVNDLVPPNVVQTIITMTIHGRVKTSVSAEFRPLSRHNRRQRRYTEPTCGQCPTGKSAGLGISGSAGSARSGYVLIIGGGPPMPKTWAIPCTTVVSTVWMTLGCTASVMKVLTRPP
jgi:hypothetical protein